MTVTWALLLACAVSTETDTEAVPSEPSATSTDTEVQSTDTEEDSETTETEATETEEDTESPKDTGPFDVDEDGWVAAEDCDDEDPDVNPDAEEVCDDGVDNDCDGGPGECRETGDFSLEDADAVFTGLASEGRLGTGVGPAGDADGDGLLDLMVGEPGASSAYVFVGAPAGEWTTEDAYAAMTGPTGAQFGASVGWVGDLDGDGHDEVGIGGPMYTGTGGVWLVAGPVSGAYDLSSTAPDFAGVATNDQYGWAVVGLGDVSNDGVDDFVISAFQADSQTGSVTIVHGGTDLASLDSVTWTGASAGEQAGRWTDGGADTNGDGLADLAVGARMSDVGGSDAGVSYVLVGPITTDGSLADADGAHMGEAGQHSGRMVGLSGDVDGDGYADLLVGGHVESSPWGGVGNRGSAWVIAGPATGESALEDATANLLGTVDFDDTAFSLDIGDVDGDGFDDVLLGAKQDAEEGSWTGGGWLAYGPLTGEVELADTETLHLTGIGANDTVGERVDIPGDVDGDGMDDLLLGAWGVDGDGQPNVGAAYLVYGRGL